MPGVDGSDSEHQQVRENTHVLDAAKTDGEDVKARRGAGRARALPRATDHTHPTAQEQATPVSVSQNHQLREKGLGAKQRGRAGDSSRSVSDTSWRRGLY